MLPALPEDALEQVRAILHSVATTEDPYLELRRRLVEIYTPNDLDLGFKLLHSPELGDRRPSQMMESMLAMLPAGEKDGVLFTCIFISRLPSDIADHVAAKAKKLSSRELAAFADNLWLARNARGGQHHVMAAVRKEPAGDEGEEDVLEAVAAMRLQRQPQKKKRTWKRGGGSQHGGGQQNGGHNDGGQPRKPNWICWRHMNYKDKAFSCDNPGKCSYSGNE